MKIGDLVKRRPTLECEKNRSGKIPPMMVGTVIYIHPAGRFHVVEFNFNNGKLRESFRNDEVT